MWIKNKWDKEQGHVTDIERTTFPLRCDEIDRQINNSITKYQII